MQQSLCQQPWKHLRASESHEPGPEHLIPKHGVLCASSSRPTAAERNRRKEQLEGPRALQDEGDDRAPRRLGGRASSTYRGLRVADLPKGTEVRFRPEAVVPLRAKQTLPGAGYVPL